MPAMYLGKNLIRDWGCRAFASGPSGYPCSSYITNDSAVADPKMWSVFLVGNQHLGMLGRSCGSRLVVC